MNEKSDLTFITNEADHNLRARFEVLIRDTKFFDCLVGYFYTSGFHAIYKSLQNTDKIRILIGIGTNQETLGIKQKARDTRLPFKRYSCKALHYDFYRR